MTTQTTVSELKINKLTRAQYNTITPSPTELYFITDESGITSSDVTDALGYTPYDDTNPSGYQANVIETVKVNGTAQTVSNKTVNISVPTSTTQLTNDSGYITGITASMVTNALTYTPYNSSNPSGYQANVIETVKVNGTALTPTTKTVSLTVPTQATDIGAVPTSRTINGKTLTTDITLSAADVSALPSSTTIPVITDTYSATSTEGMSGKAVASAISGKADKAVTLLGYGITDAYTKTEVDSLVSSVYKPAGSVAFASLPTLAAGVLGNVYNVTDAFTTTSDFVEGAGKTYPADTNVVVVDVSATSTPSYKFDVLAGFVDLSGYQLSETAVTHTKNTAVGNATVPVYIDTNGVATTCTALNTAAYVADNTLVHLAGAETITGNKTFSGTVSLGASASATTPATSSNTTAVATTAFVKAQGYITGITSSDVTTALGYTPANTFSTTNPTLTSSNDVCTWTITHNLGDNVEVHVYNNTTKKEVMASVSLTSSTVATIELFSTADLASGAYKAVAIGK